MEEHYLTIEEHFMDSMRLDIACFNNSFSSSVDPSSFIWFLLKLDLNVAVSLEKCLTWSIYW